MMKPEQIASAYTTFANREARGVSAIYENYARSVARNEGLLGRLKELPDGKQQPNLLFASTRHSVGLPDAKQDFAEYVLEFWDTISPVILARSTQTNEPARCACLLPALTQTDGPLALIEVGASAGLCLLPDLYGYDYGHTILRPTKPGAPVFPCKASKAAPIPKSVPQVTWRAGLDLNPLDLQDDDDVQWLRTLVWPEQTERLARLDAAIGIARQEPPRIVKGDLLHQTEALAAQAPSDARLVIFHTAVLNYVAPKIRKEFAALMGDLGAEWLANESPRVLPGVAVTDTLPAQPGAFVLSRNGLAIALTGPHGQFVDWL